jgi:hypothetical protein
VLLLIHTNVSVIGGLSHNKTVPCRYHGALVSRSSLLSYLITCCWYHLCFLRPLVVDDDLSVRLEPIVAPWACPFECGVQSVPFTLEMQVLYCTVLFQVLLCFRHACSSSQQPLLCREASCHKLNHQILRPFPQRHWFTFTHEDRLYSDVSSTPCCLSPCIHPTPSLELVFLSAQPTHSQRASGTCTASYYYRCKYEVIHW